MNLTTEEKAALRLAARPHGLTGDEAKLEVLQTIEKLELVSPHMEGKPPAVYRITEKGKEVLESYKK